MGEFKRSPSKVWWANGSVEWREVSGSPGSQDSGFSDSETSPPLHGRNNKEEQQRITTDIFKQSEQKPQNLAVNYREKETPDKNIKLNSGSPPVSRYIKNSPSFSRNMFDGRYKKEPAKDIVHIDNQYSKDTTTNTTHSSICCEITNSDSNASVIDSYESIKTSRSLPLIKNTKDYCSLNKTAPAVLECIKDEEEISLNGNHSLSSDCESELECLFNSPLESPKHTSTPKAISMNRIRNRKQKIAQNLFLKYKDERVPPVYHENAENLAVQTWKKEIALHYEQECMTTLQTKSIAAELNREVSCMAIHVTNNIRNILAHSNCIETEYKNLNGEKRHVGPLAQSLAGNIVDFLKKFIGLVDSNVIKQYDNIRKTTNENTLQLISELFNVWQPLHQQLLLKETKTILELLENPRSELQLRAIITGVTSICLRNEILIETFIKNDIVPILLILCEKCEGSSMRSLLLRALSTMCCNSPAVRQFEKYSGIQIVSDTLEEDSRPEPERSEAVALLAQVTAPWIEDNHCIKGLEEYSRQLVKSLTKFASTTQCCQNLLLCAAALANLSSMDQKCVRYMLHLKTIPVLLEKVNKRSTCMSVYFLEQVATLIANISAEDAARKQLTELKAVTALLSFLNTTGIGEDMEKRLQQKSIIALSRLCSDRDAAKQVVEFGGVEKLVKICRNRNERFDSDAVLVATLATLRKIFSVCGREVISAEDAQELIEPKLLDSFLAYSAQSESYV